MRPVPYPAVPDAVHITELTRHLTAQPATYSTWNLPTWKGVNIYGDTVSIEAVHTGCYRAISDSEAAVVWVFTSPDSLRTAFRAIDPDGHTHTELTCLHNSVGGHRAYTFPLVMFTINPAVYDEDANSFNFYELEETITLSHMILLAISPLHETGETYTGIALPEQFISGIRAHCDTPTPEQIRISIQETLTTLELHRNETAASEPPPQPPLDDDPTAELAARITELEQRCRKLGSSETHHREAADRLRVRVDHLNDTISHLRDQHAADKAELHRLRRTNQPASIDLALTASDTGHGFRNPLDAVTAAAHDFPLLTFHPQVFDRLDRYHYPTPEHIYDDLAALNLLAARWRSSGRLEGGLEQAAIAAGLSNFRRNITDDVAAQHPADYTMTVDGETRRFDPHFGRGARTAANCYRCYMWIDEPNRRIVIGHIGAHLPDTTYNN